MGGLGRLDGGGLGRLDGGGLDRGLDRLDGGGLKRLDGGGLDRVVLGSRGVGHGDRGECSEHSEMTNEHHFALK